MNALSIIKVLLTLASKIAEYFRDKQLMDAGASEAILKGIQDADAAIDRANAARGGVLPPTDTDSNNRDNQH